MDIEKHTPELPFTPDQAQAEWDRLAAEKGPGDTPAPATPTPEPEPPATEPEPEPNPWDGVPDIVRQKLEGLDLLDHRVRSAEGRVGALQRDLHEARQAPPQAPAAPSAEAAGRWNELSADYPELAVALEERLAAERRAEQEALQRLDQQTQSYERRIAELSVEVHHPGWQQTVQGEAFRTWLGQHPELSGLASSPEPADAIALLNQFGGGRNQADAVLEQRQKRLQNSAEPPPRDSGKPPASSEEGMTDEEYWHYLSSQKAAQLEQQRRFNR